MDDVFGQVLKDYYYEGKKNPVFYVVRDDGHIGDSLMADKYFSHYKFWPKPENKIIKYSKGKVLDIGAGAGRHSLYLQRKKHDVKAVDASPGAVKIMKERGVKKAYIQDINNLSLEEDFDTILLMGNNFGLAGTIKKTIILLNYLYKKTKSQARIIGTTRDPFVTSRNIHKRYHKRNVKDNKPAGLLKLKMVYKELESSWYNYLLFNREELFNLLSKTLWKKDVITRNYGDIYGIVLKK